MAFIWTVFAMIFSLTYCKAEPENCTQCKLVPVEEGLASEFHLQASEKGVRMVYLNLKIGNESYNPLELPDEFLPERWVWANAISEPMLSLSYDYDILSLGLLTYQVRRMNVQLTDEPRGCLANLNSSCQNKVVGRALLNLTAQDSSDSGELLHNTDVVCVAVIDEKIDFFGCFFEGNVIFDCCSRKREHAHASTQKSSIECEIKVKSSVWFKALNGVLNTLTLVFLFYCPAFLMALPDFIFNLEEECRKEIEKEQSEDLGNSSGNDEFSQLFNTLFDLPTGRYGSINQDLLSTERDESGPSQNGDESTQNSNQLILRIAVDGNSNTQTIDSQPNHRTSENNSVNLLSQSKRLVYLDDTSPVVCSSFFGKYAEDFTDLIPFNVKLAFLTYCVIPIFVYIKLGINYTLKKEFFEEASTKQGALLVGPLFAYLFTMESCVIVTIVAFSLIIILLSSPKDFFLTNKCLVCREKTLSVGEDMIKHIELLQQKACSFTSWFIKLHKEGITKVIEFCILPCLKKIRPPYKRLKRALIVCWLLLCNVFIVTIVVVLLGVVYFAVVLVGLSFLCLRLSPLTSIMNFSAMKVLELAHFFAHWLVIKQVRFKIFFFVVSSIGLVPFLLAFYILSVVACFVGALSCRFIVRMFGFIIMGVILNADIASPYVTFLIVVLTNMYLCYYNLQKKYQEVKQMISHQWQKNKPLGDNNNLSKSEEGTIPEDLFWHICGEKAKSEHKVLPIRNEIFRMIRNMAVILIFLFLALCSIIFFGRTYNISAVISIIAVFVSGVIPGLFFRGLTKKNRFSGATKKSMMEEIEAAIEEYKNTKSTTIQRQGGDDAPQD